MTKNPLLLLAFFALVASFAWILSRVMIGEPLIIRDLVILVLAYMWGWAESRRIAEQGDGEHLVLEGKLSELPDELRKHLLAKMANDERETNETEQDATRDARDAARHSHGSDEDTPRSAASAGEAESGREK